MDRKSGRIVELRMKGLRLRKNIRRRNEKILRKRKIV